LERIATIRKFIVDNFLFGDESKLPASDTSFLNNGIIDSTGMLEVINFIEETFAIKVEDNELLPENLDSLKNLDAFIASKKAS
jgi:acyl carrier protein